MKKEYDFSKMKGERNPYAKKRKVRSKPRTRLEEDLLRALDEAVEHSQGKKKLSTRTVKRRRVN